MQKYVVFLYTNNGLSNKQIKKTISFAIMSERVHYLKINPTKEVKVKVKVAQSCPKLRNSMDYAAHGILQARILKWAAFPFSRGSS